VNYTGEIFRIGDPFRTVLLYQSSCLLVIIKQQTTNHPSVRLSVRPVILLLGSRG